MTNPIKRDDTKYIEIEKFAPHELSNCVAYEMAIRNPKVIVLKKDINDLMKGIHVEYINKRDDFENPFNTKFDELYREYEESLEDDEIEELHEPNYKEYFINTNEETLEIKNKLQILLNDYWIRYFFYRRCSAKST